MDITDKLDKFASKRPSGGEKTDLIILESKDLSSLEKQLEKVSKEFENNEYVSHDVVMNIKALHDQIKTLLNKPQYVTERLIPFGKNAAADVQGSSVTISKNGKSIELSKQELVELIKRTGLQVQVCMGLPRGM